MWGLAREEANTPKVWEYFSKDVEVAQGRTIADACKEAGVSHYIWSSLIHAGKGTVCSYQLKYLFEY